MSSEQVASVLRQPSMHGQVISFIVARPVHNNVTDIDLVNLQEDNDSENFKTMLNQLNSAGTDHPNSFVLRTNEIMDKNLDLQEKLKAEMEKRIRAAKTALKEATSTNEMNLLISHEENPNIDVISDIVDTNCSLKEINKIKNDDLDDDDGDVCEMDSMKLPVKTSTPIRFVLNKTLVATVSQNTALVESIIEIEQQKQNKMNNKTDLNYSIEANDKTLVQEESTSVVITTTTTATNKNTDEEAKLTVQTCSLDSQTVVLSNLATLKSRQETVECHKRIEEILRRKSFRTDLLSDEVNAIDLEACNQFLAETFSFLIAFEELNLPNYMETGVSYKNTESYFYVKEKLKSASATSGLEVYDQIIEINSKPVGEFMSTTDFTSEDIQLNLSIKLVKNLDLKIYKLKSKWKHLLEANSYLYDDMNNEDFIGDEDFEIVVVQVDKTKTKSLGISLEGTVDIDDNGLETCAHHYIRSIMASGPVDKAM